MHYSGFGLIRTLGAILQNHILLSVRSISQNAMHGPCYYQALATSTCFLGFGHTYLKLSFKFESNIQNFVNSLS